MLNAPNACFQPLWRLFLFIYSVYICCLKNCDKVLREQEVTGPLGSICHSCLRRCLSRMKVDMGFFKCFLEASKIALALLKVLG